MNDATVNTCVPVVVWTYVTIFFLGMFLGVDVPGHKAMLCFTFENTATLFSQVVSPLCNLCGRRLSTEEKGGGAYEIQ